MKDPIDFVRPEQMDKHYSERALQGFSTFDWWNFDTYIAWVIASAVEKFKESGHTSFVYPDEPHENWEALTNGEYQVMIDGFKNYIEYQNNPDMWEKETWQEVARGLEDALELFKNRFMSLWD